MKSGRLLVSSLIIRWRTQSLLTRIRIRGINDNRDNAVHGCLYCRFIQDSL